MIRQAVCCVFFAVALSAGLALTVGRARASEPPDTLPRATLEAPTNEVQDKQPSKDKVKEPPEKKLPESKLPSDIFDPALLPSNSEVASGFIPQMIGDFATYFVLQRVTVLGTQTTTRTQFNGTSEGPTTVTTTQAFSTTRVVRIPIATLGAFNIAENESPRPTDRVFFTYNYFGNIHGADTGASAPIVSTQTTGVGFGATTTTTVIPGVTPPALNLNRELWGFEKTFLDGRASMEMRLPIFQQIGTTGLGGVTSNDIGDLTVLGKYAFLLDNTTGNVVSGGFVVTAPTGAAIPLLQGNPVHSTLLQPWFGYIWNFNTFYVQAFHSVVAPTDPRDVTLMFNDVGINYWLYRGAPGSFVNSVVPTVEAHVTTPLNHRANDDPLSFPDLVAITAGFHMGLGRNAWMTIGAVTPVTGPRVFNIEALAQFNWRF